MKKAYAQSANLLVNDIQSFANFYRQFRDSYPSWFSDDDHGLLSANKTAQSDAFVPVAPTLSSVFFQLQLVDEYRSTGISSNLQELLQEQFNLSMVK